MRRARRVLGSIVLGIVAAVARSSGPLPDWASECPDALTPPDHGNVLGVAEKPIADLVQLARTAESKAALAAGTGTGDLSDDERAAAEDWLVRARDAIDSALACIIAEPAVQPSTDLHGAAVSLGKARRQDVKQIEKLASDNHGHGVDRRKLQQAIAKADRDKKRAIYLLSGVHLTASEDGTAYDPPAGTVFPYATEALRFEGPADRNLRKGRNAGFDGAGKLVARVFPDRSPVPPGKGRAKARKNHVLSFHAPKGVESAFGFFSLPRELRGPFQYSFVAGDFEPAPSDAVYLNSNSFVGVEMDVQGSNPLEFFSVGTRYVVNDPEGTSKGVQVFANARGQSLGSRFLPAVQRVDVRVVFRGGVFRASVKPHGAADDQYVEFATYDRGASDEVWVAGIGGAGFTGKRVLGVDDLVIEPIGP